MSLSTAAKQAREHADVCGSPGCVAAAAALESALDAEAREQINGLKAEPNLAGIAPPGVRGFR